ncbi:MAG: exo-alpha-sialidase [Granulosicoccus sp.]|nr:exo-alpha-sialidase [Granulosicoccus sp.]
MNLLIGTRKGLFTYTRDDQGWQAVSETFLGDPIPMLLPDRRDGTWYVAVEHGHFGTKLHRSDDQGQHWEELDAPRYPEKPDDVPDTLCPMRQIPIPWSLEKIWTLQAGGVDQPGTLWCGTIPGGLFKSTDRGASWALNRPLWDMPERAKWCGGGYDYPGIHSIELNPANADDLVLGISCGGVWRTRDGGQSWAQMAHGMFYDFNPDEPEDTPDAQDPHCVVRCAADPEQMWSQHHCGIFKWQPGESRWQRQEGIKPSAFGFAVAVHPDDPETAWFVPAVKDEWRYPVDGKLVVTRTRDGGQTFETLSGGLPQGKAYDLIYRHGLAVDDTGRTLAMGSTTGALWVSGDGGEQWELLSAHLPPIYCVRLVN